MYILSIQNLFKENTTVLSVLLNQFAWETQNFHTILVNPALNGIMHVSVYCTSELYYELKKIQLKLLLTLEFPVTELHLLILKLLSKLSTLRANFC